MSNPVLVHLKNRAEKKQTTSPAADVIDFPDECAGVAKASQLALRLLVQRLRQLERHPEKLGRVKIGELTRAYKLLTEEHRFQAAELAAQQKPERQPIGIEEAREMLDQIAQVARGRSASAS